MVTLDREQTAAPLIGVGLVGESSTSRFLCERLSLRCDLRLVAVCVEDNSKTQSPSSLSEIWFAGIACPASMTVFNLIAAPEVRVIHFAAGSSSDMMFAALARSKSIIVEAPQELTSGELERLASVAIEQGQIAAIYEPRRWDRDFLQARYALMSGRIGKLMRLRYAVHDSRLPGELFPLGIARELGSHVLDQLLQLVGPIEWSVRGDSVPHVWRHFPSASGPSDGFAASFEFAEEVSAIIEIQTRSHLGYRSGWMLDGTAGAYRNGCLYTRTVDGEIVDEPLPAPTVSSDPFLDALGETLRGSSTDLPTVRDAVRVAAFLCNLPTEAQLPHRVALPASN